MYFQQKGIRTIEGSRLSKRLARSFLFFDLFLVFFVILLGRYGSLLAISLFEVSIFLICGFGLCFYGYKVLKLFPPNSHSRIQKSTYRLFKIIVAITSIHIIRIPIILIYSYYLFKKMTVVQDTLFSMFYWIIVECLPVLLMTFFVFEIPAKQFYYRIDSEGSDPIIYD
ncbi:tobamovirus multiplication protein 1-like isoform x1 [Anaeramoeba flamelloides]|uniref:Tobamovirus multiplication protein 1-like isoform x1 n=1 Tax=Anaeramoeba flamelloides TaxID=1746091 RepID=A0AAV7ZX07_9EUKA|nr:tobamovirus multiplication protein 1-like isoform x1 [Anaeramoeba flamelloides]